MNRYLFTKSRLVLLYLRGLRGIFENNLIVDKGRNRLICSLMFGMYCYFWSKQNLIKHEFDSRQQPNFLIPKFVYKSRREHYIYWEQSRLARGKQTLFSYYEWDPQSQMIFYIDKFGRQTSERNIFNRERLDIVENPLFEEVFRNQTNMSPQLFQRGNQLVAYQKNINNRFDLDNYLSHKSITIGDFIRALFYQFYVQLNFANKYRYDQFISKSDKSYEFETIKLGLNIQNHKDQDIQKNIQRWVDIYIFYITQLDEWLRYNKE